MSEARILPVEPLTREAFAPYGQVIDCMGIDPVAINDGTALKFPELATVELLGGGEAAISIYRAEPRRLPMPLLELERHPLGSQAFVPLRPTRYLVVVAGSNPEPRPEDIRVFLATGQQGVNFRASIWHHALLALDECDFLIVDRKAPGNLEDRSIASWKLMVSR